MTDEKVKKGDLVKVHYTGKFESGKVFDQSKDQPLEFIAGEKMVVKGFDDAVIDMKKGEKKTITVEPKEGYGEANPKLVQTVPKEAFGEKVKELKEGVTIGLQHPQMPGRMMPALVKKIGDKEVTLDLNHPLASKTLTFDVEMVDFHEATDEDKKKFTPPQKPVQEKEEDNKDSENKKQESEEEGCSGDCASCGKH
jgi:FKBP-type peptidyl-prolyl cis-trans isomerase 2